MMNHTVANTSTADARTAFSTDAAASRSLSIKNRWIARMYGGAIIRQTIIMIRSAALNGRSVQIGRRSRKWII
jgi:hypothetical protein